jgi:hypothetical protein
MPKLVRGPLCAVRSRLFDSARWDRYAPRKDDIVIATYPKCGTTWTQRIVGMLVFGSEKRRKRMKKGRKSALPGKTNDPVPRRAARRLRRCRDASLRRGAEPRRRAAR